MTPAAEDVDGHIHTRAGLGDEEPQDDVEGHRKMMLGDEGEKDVEGHKARPGV